VEKSKYPALTELSVFELVKLRLEAKKYYDTDFDREILLEFKRRAKLKQKEEAK
jgi:hypothetical protein